MSAKKHLPFWFFSISVVFGLTLPVLIQDAMFQDAMLYSSVSHNLSQGIGTFWFPQYSKYNIAGLSSFHEHPPLLFGIQALFFKALGSSIYVERFYTFLMILFHIWLINLLWKVVFPKTDVQRKLGWLPVLFWIIISVDVFLCNAVRQSEDMAAGRVRRDDISCVIHQGHSRVVSVGSSIFLLAYLKEDRDLAMRKSNCNFICCSGCGLYHSVFNPRKQRKPFQLCI